MKTALVITILALSVAVSAAAQTGQPHFELIARYVRIDPQGTNSFADLGSGYKQKAAGGFGAAVNFFVARPISVELGAAQVNSPATLDAGSAGRLPLGSLRLRPITAAVQWHPMAGGRFDVYAGAGGMYMMAGSLTGSGLGDIGIDSITFKSRAAAMANAGIAIGVTHSLAVDVDVKYAQLKSESRARFSSDGSQSVPLDIKINPLMYSVGLRFRF